MSSVLFHCEMLFPEPNGHVIIETDFNGTFSTLLSSLNGEYGTDYAWIEDIKNKMTDCWYRMVVTFGLKNVSMKWHRKRIRCTAKPSEDAVDQTVYISDSKAVKVLQGAFVCLRYCSRMRALLFMDVSLQRYNI